MQNPRNAKNIQEKGWLKVLSWHLGFCSGHMDHQANFMQLICTCGPTEVTLGGSRCTGQFVTYKVEKCK